MRDLYLEALMQGQILKKNINKAIVNKEKNRFEIETEKEIDAFIATLKFDDDDPTQDKFYTPEMKRARIKIELQEHAKLSELSAFIETAFSILTSQGPNYLHAKEYELMLIDFEKANKALDEIDLNIPPTQNFQTILLFGDATIDSIFKIAVAKFNEGQFPDSLSLFVLLATLIPEVSDFWHRAGILAQKCENYELATRLFNAASSLDPTMIGPKVFSIDCYLKRDMGSDAKASYDEAMKICESSQVDTSWKEMLSDYQAILVKT